jgi:hypothetical protein
VTLLDDARLLLHSSIARRAYVHAVLDRVAGRRLARRKPLADIALFSSGRTPYSELIAESAHDLDYRRLLDKSSLEAMLSQHQDWISKCASLALEHRFDLGGRAWICLKERAEPFGLMGTKYAGTARARIEKLLESGVQGLEDPAPDSYAMGRADIDCEPIPWHRDPLTGFRWDPARQYSATDLGAAPGADPRFVWEVGRMQHLPLLAMASWAGSHEFRRRLQAEFSSQIADFCASNPTGSGIHWASGMEVGIRLANIVLALHLFLASGAEFEDGDVETIVGSVLDHIVFCLANPDRRPFLTHNHYLVQISGVVLGTAMFEDGIEAEGFNPSRILRFAAAELCKQVCEQFQKDGSNFEGSTGYHLFALQAAAFGLAVVMRRAPDTAGLYEAIDKLAGAVRFLDVVTDDTGRLPMIGDFDGGRFVVLERRFTDGSDCVWDRLYSQPVIGAAAEVSGAVPAHHPDAGDSLDAAVARSIVGESHRRSAGGWTRSDETLDLADWPVISMIADRWDAARSRSKRLWLFTEEGPDARFGAGTSRDLPLETASELIDVFSEGVHSPHVYRFSDFGLYVYRGDRLFMTIRCGPPGQRGWAGHSHADQLSMTLVLGGRELLSDPGSFVYGAVPEIRRAYRSSRAHNGPYADGIESLRQGRSLFGAPGAADGKCFGAYKKAFVGKWSSNGASFWRLVLISGEGHVASAIHDLASPAPKKTARGSSSRVPRPIWSVAVLDWSDGAPLGEHTRYPVSPAYGWLAGPEGAQPPNSL